MKKRKLFLPLVAVSAAVAAVLTFSYTIAYFVDTDQKENIITIGNVEITLRETSFNEAYTSDKPFVASAGSVIPKNPTIQNTGTNDEYVFIKVAVPKKTVTLLEESGTNKGKPYTNYATSPQSTEIFKIIADGVTGGAAKADIINETGNNLLTSPEYIFSYNKGDKDTSKEGWLYLGRDFNNSNENYYYFGYNKKMLKKSGNTIDETVPLFDRIQLKSFIDQELNNYDADIKITAYGIQADNLEITDLPEGEGIMTLEKVNAVYGIVQRKQVMNSGS